jgi:hypothetical protein
LEPAAAASAQREFAQAILKNLPEDVVVFRLHGSYGRSIVTTEKSIYVTVPAKNVKLLPANINAPRVRLTDIPVESRMATAERSGILISAANSELVEVELGVKQFRDFLNTLLDAQPGVTNLSYEAFAFTVEGMEQMAHLRPLLGARKIVEGKRLLFMSCNGGSKAGFVEEMMKPTMLGKTFKRTYAPTGSTRPVRLSNGEYGMYVFGEDGKWAVFEGAVP